MISTERFKKKLKKIKRKGERQKVKYELEGKYAKYYPSHKRKVSNVMLVVVVCAITIYTIANLWITYATGVTADSTLTTCVFAFWGSELVCLAGIRVGKIIKSPQHDEFEVEIEQEELEEQE